MRIKNDKTKKDDLDVLLEEKSPVEPSIESNTTKEYNTISIEQVAEVVETAQEEKPKKARKRSPGRKSKEQLEQEKKAEDMKLILRGSFSFALVGFSNAISQLLDDEKWKIDQEKEAEFLAMTTINYLDERFPEWEKASPEVTLIMGWSSYFVKRLLVLSENSDFAKEFNKSTRNKGQK